jgi:hypothetical protein
MFFTACLLAYQNLYYASVHAPIKMKKCGPTNNCVPRSYSFIYACEGIYSTIFEFCCLYKMCKLKIKVGRNMNL